MPGPAAAVGCRDAESRSAGGPRRFRPGHADPRADPRDSGQFGRGLMGVRPRVSTSPIADASCALPQGVSSMNVGGTDVSQISEGFDDAARMPGSARGRHSSATSAVHRPQKPTRSPRSGLPCGLLVDARRGRPCRLATTELAHASCPASGGRSLEQTSGVRSGRSRDVGLSTKRRQGVWTSVRVMDSLVDFLHDNLYSARGRARGRGERRSQQPSVRPFHLAAVLEGVDQRRLKAGPRSSTGVVAGGSSRVRAAPVSWRTWPRCTSCTWVVRRTWSGRRRRGRWDPLTTSSHRPARRTPR